MRPSPNRRVVAALLVLVASGAAGCNPHAAQIRRVAERGDVPQALRLYRSHVRERGSSNLDALVDVATVVLRRAAASSDVRERNAGFAAIRGLGSRGHALLRELESDRGVVGDRAAAARYDLDGREGGPPARLIAAAESTDSERRVAGLAAYDGQRNVTGLLAALASVSRDVRRAAATRLARYASELGVTDALGEHALRDPDEMVRMSCISALGSHGARAASVLEQALADRETFVRMAVVSALGNASPSRAAVLLAPLMAREPDAIALEAARVLAARGHPTATGYILSALESTDPAIRAQAAVCAASLGDAHLAELAPHIEDADVEVQIRVGGLLARTETYRPRVIRALRPVAQRPDPMVAIRALGVLAEAGDSAAVDPLRGALASRDTSVRRLAVLAWSNLAGTSGEADPLAPLLEDPDRSVRLMAAAEVVRIASR